MTAIELARLGVAAGLVVVLTVIAVSDGLHRKIPNAALIVMLGVFVLWALVNRGAGLLSSLEAAAIALVVTAGLYLFKIIGAGDSKLFTVAALFSGLAYLPLMAFVTVMIGGVIALAILIRRPIRGLVMFQLRGKGDWGPGIPYGVPIAIACAAVVWAPLLGLHPLNWVQV